MRNAYSTVSGTRAMAFAVNPIKSILQMDNVSNMSKRHYVGITAAIGERWTNACAIDIAFPAQHTHTHAEAPMNAGHRHALNAA